MMKALIATKYGNAAELIEFVDVEKPSPGSGEVLVKNMAIATNPIDYKVIMGLLEPGKDAPANRLIVGWDSAGVIETVGEGVTDFRAGDEVWFAGDITKDGCYAQYTKIDARIISKKPKSLSFEDAAVIPLTFQTAWEGLVEQMNVQKGKTLFVLNGAGGLGSIVIQLGKHLGLTVIASASRRETVQWCNQMGADHIINHRSADLADELKRVGFGPVDYVFNAHENDRLAELLQLLAVDGKLTLTFGTTKENWENVDLKEMWLKRKTICNAMMFSRSMFDADPATVGRVMATGAQLVDEGAIKTTVSKKFDSWEKMRDATALQMSGKAVGKTTLTVKH